MNRLLPTLIMLCVLLSSCSQTVTTADSGPGGVDALPNEPDASNEDQDVDGLCDRLEEALGTSITETDSDGDGFSDWFEYVNRFDPLASNEPERDRFVYITESEGSSTTYEFDVEIRGEGESYFGSFEALEAYDLVEERADRFFDTIFPTFALPETNAGALVPETSSFEEVVGRTVLGFSARFAFGDATSRGCVRAYPFRLFIKSSEGALIYRRTQYLLVRPPGQTSRTADWCYPAEVLCPR